MASNAEPSLWARRQAVCGVCRPDGVACLPGACLWRGGMYPLSIPPEVFRFCMHTVLRGPARGSAGGRCAGPRLGSRVGRQFRPCGTHASPYLRLRQACQRYWTEGGMLRNVPVGAGRRKTSKAAAREGDAKQAANAPPAGPAAAAAPPLVPFPLVPEAVLLSALAAPAAELRAPCGAAEPRADPAEHGRRVRPRLELSTSGESVWQASADAGPAFGEWASMAAQQQLQQHAALQAAAFGQAQLMGAGWGAGGNPYLPLWPYNVYGGPNWAVYAGCARPPFAPGWWLLCACRAAAALHLF